MSWATVKTENIKKGKKYHRDMEELRIIITVAMKPNSVFPT